MDQPLLSLCMIARDEERWLPMSLGSARPWVDELVVVDTGSQDGSVEIARQMGAQVFNHPWQNDFALARNQSMSHARGRWLLFMDADEELDQAKAPALRQCLISSQLGQADRVYIEILHLALDGGHSLQVIPRLIRASAGISFVGKIHERLQGGSGLAGRAPVRLIHHGFAQPAEVLAVKARRNLALIQAWAAEQPNSLPAWCSLAQTLMTSAETAPQALAAGLKARQLALEQQPAPHHWPRVYHPILMALTHLGRHDEIIAMAQECLARLPLYPDPLYSLTWVHFIHGRWPEVLACAQRFLDLQSHWRDHPLQYPYGDNLSQGLLDRVLAWRSQAQEKLR